MKSFILSVDGKKAGELELPVQFSESFRPDVIRRAFNAYQSANRQAYGTDHDAGLRTSAKYMGKRSSYGSWANRGMSRIARIRIGSGHMTGTVRLIPQARKGRASHGPNAEKIWLKSINTKERKLAIRSAIAATVQKDAVALRNHKFGEHFPLIVESKFADLSKSKDVYAVLEKFGLGAELERASKRKVRAGIGKTRSRKYRSSKGPLVIVADNSKISKAATNIPGIEVAEVKNLNINLLAPGGQAGRLAIWTEDAVKKIGKENLFI